MSAIPRLEGEVIDQIIWELRLDMSISRIAKICHVGRDRVNDVIRAFKRGERLDHQMGRPRKATPEVISRIVTLSLTNGRLSDQALANQLHEETGCQISRQTVNSVRHSERFNFGPPKRVPKLEPWHIQCRQQFVMDWNGELFRTIKHLPIVFSDESRFCLGTDNTWTWQRRGEYFLSNMIQEEKFYRFSVMVWGAIGRNFKSDLIVCEGSIDSQRYITFLRNSQFFIQADNHFGHNNWIFQQDGATCHTSDFSLTELSKYCLPIPEWPPNSPDLNVIEVIWGIMKRRLKAERITSKTMAKEAILQEWRNLSFDTINRLVDSFETRVHMVADAGGRTIQPLLNAHKMYVPSGYLPDRPVIPLLYPWTADEDRKILELIEKFKRPNFNQLQQRWFPTRLPQMLRNRWKVLKTQKWNGGEVDFLRDS
jgi:transposase